MNQKIEEDEENSNEESSQGEIDVKWKLDCEKEKIFWDKTVLVNLIYRPTICPKCKKQTYQIYEEKS